MSESSNTSSSSSRHAATELVSFAHLLSNEVRELAVLLGLPEAMDRNRYGRREAVAQLLEEHVGAPSIPRALINELKAQRDALDAQEQPEGAEATPTDMEPTTPSCCGLSPTGMDDMGSVSCLYVLCDVCVFSVCVSVMFLCCLSCFVRSRSLPVGTPLHLSFVPRSISLSSLIRLDGFRQIPRDI